jgi:hypothetical protein
MTPEGARGAPARRGSHRLELGAPLSRRDFVVRVTLAGLGASLAGLSDVVAGRGWVVPAKGEASLVRDTLNGVGAFVVPGPDRYSVAQGHSSDRPGAIAARASDGLIELLEALAPVTAPGNAATVAAVLNAVAHELSPRASGRGFRSPFARLSFAEKGIVFAPRPRPGPAAALPGRRRPGDRCAHRLLRIRGTRSRRAAAAPAPRRLDDLGLRGRGRRARRAARLLPRPAAGLDPRAPGTDRCVT